MQPNLNFAQNHDEDDDDEEIDDHLGTFVNEVSHIDQSKFERF